MIAIMWQFEVKPGCETEFEELYGVEGEWTVEIAARVSDFDEFRAKLNVPVR